MGTEHEEANLTGPEDCRSIDGRSVPSVVSGFLCARWPPRCDSNEAEAHSTG